MKLLDDGLDEMAARAYQGLWPRLAALAGTGLIVSMILPWIWCAAWFAFAAGSEAVFVVVSRPQARGERATSAGRLAYVSTLVIGCLAWTILAGALWASGSIAGLAGALILWLAIIFFAQNNAYQSTTGFVLAGGLPAVCMIGFIAVGPNPLHVPRLPVGGLALIAMGFVIDGVMRTLAARRRFEETQAQLGASEQQYRMLADNISDVLWLNRADGSRIYVSPSVRRALGYEPEEVFADNFGFVHPDDAEAAQAAVLAAARAGSGLHQCRMIAADGRTVWMEHSLSVAPDPGGDAPLVITLSRNVEARKQLEDALVDAREHAEQAAAAKSDFLANMTHELRTPLNAIIGFSGILKTSPRLSPEDARQAHLISDASDTLLVLVNSVLDFSRLEAGAVQLEAKPFETAAPVRATAAMLAEQAAAKGLELRVEVAEDVPHAVAGDEARIHQVLLNLVSNAIKFTAEGGVTVTLRRTGHDGEVSRLRFSVADTGIGVAPEQIEHLFDRFTQADATVSRQYGGTGLGLAICKRTVELMGGALGCESTPGQGATFWFELALPEAEAPVAAVGAPTIEAPGAPLHVLLAEDVPVNRELIRALLAPFDVRLDMAQNGAEALAAVQTERYDLVLMDVQMPVMDGLTAARAIRALADPAAREVPIVAMTANVLPDQVARCREAGMDDHIGKPISPAALLEALNRWSQGREAVAAALSA